MALAIVFCAVITMNSVSMRSSRARTSTSRPERSGMRMSIRATSKERARNAASASAPLATAATLWPRWAQARSSTQRMDSSSSATRMLAGRSVGVDMLGAGGQRHAETRAAAAARLIGDRAAVLAHDAVAEGEAEAGAARLGGEEGCEEVRLVLLGHAGATVLDQHGEELLATARLAPDVEAMLDPGRDPQLARAPHGLDGVAHEVVEDLRELRAVPTHRRQARVELRPQRDRAPARGLPLEREHVVEHAVDVHRPEGELAGLGELAELLDEAVEALDLADDDVGAADLLGVGQLRAQELSGALDAAERVADLVRQPLGDRAERRETVRMGRRGLERALEAQVVEDEDRTDEHPLAVVHRGARGAHRGLALPRGEQPFAAAAREALGERAPHEVADPGIGGIRAEERRQRLTGGVGGGDAGQIG